MKKNGMALIKVAVFCIMMMAAGAAWPAGIPGIPNGTVTDGNLVWLKNANCFGEQHWIDAMNSAKNLKSGSCGLTDGSKAGDWRLPTKEELLSRQRNQQGFNNVQADYYWSSSSYEKYTGYAWMIRMSDGYVGNCDKGFSYYAWPVRAK